MTSEPSFPLYEGKHALPSVVDPGEHAAYVRDRHPDATLTQLDGVVLLYQQRTMDHAQEVYPTRPQDGWVRGHLRLLDREGRALGICGGFGPGAPATALVLEQIIALGARRVITVGTCATLQPGLTAGDLVVCTQALRDEGVSHHYLAPGTTVEPSETLTGRLAGALTALGTPVRQGMAWTTDAPYRETAAEVAHHRARGVLAADMEAAAVFAVAQHRAVPAAAVFVAADSLIDRRPRRDAPGIRRALGTALEGALTAVAAAAQP
ncbi:nucleoside phosphorylase [Streptomyces cavernicola]|uniref:Uridine phosphorylase n=1 Tax=Streptomyces cavernicola TaxID=3043613 RepID=A0ABT6SL45_9ACTN|nr:nucleoside phosphorylase [Streptomyces sp. B-S-A6]MDI3408920.1 nucleoside phosphorylase [Streptomyces sp. B-S-A6]